MSGLLAVLRMILTLFVKGAESSPVASKKKVDPEVPTKANPLFKDDSKRLKGELADLQTRNFQLYHLLYDICDFCKRRFSKSVVITMIYRTQEEQDSIYKDDPKYKVKKFTSPHQYYHAIDLRSKTFTPEEIETLVNYLNLKYNNSNYYKFTAKCHTVGNGAEHFHIQYSRDV